MERILIDKNGKDTGVRENRRGAMYINKKVFFSDEKVSRTLSRLNKSGIVKIEIHKKE